MIGFNPHQIPGLLRVAQKMKNAYTTGDQINEFCKNSIASVNGHTYYFSYESGKVWMRNGSTGVITLVATVAAALGESKILGAYEYQNYIYIATEKKVHRIPSNVASTPQEWTDNLVLNWAEFNNGDKELHPMRDQNLVLYIGDGNLLAQVDAGTFSPDALDIAPPLRIKSLGKIGTDLLIGTFVSDKVTKTELFRWNTYSGSFQVSNQIDEVGINAFLQTDNFVYVQAGLWGRIYVYDYINNRLESFKTVPGEYSPLRYATCNPDAVATISGIALFGMSNGLGDPCDEGVYAIGRHSRNYPYILDLPYPISEREEDGSFALSGVEIGSITVSGFDVFVTWRRTVGNVVTVGLDILDYSNKLNGAYIDSRVMSNIRTMNTNFDKFFVAYASLPAQTDIQILYSKNYGQYTPTTTKTDPDRNILFSEGDRIDATTLQVRLKMVTNGNDAPEVESAGVQLI